MKRSRGIKLVLLGGFSAGAFTGCAPSSSEPQITPSAVYPNDYHVPGAGYYHAPFHAFYPQPYNSYDPQRKLYFYGGQWGPQPYQSIINVSEPSADAVRAAESIRSGVVRGGFGSTSHTYHIWS